MMSDAVIDHALFEADDVSSSAVISEDGRYRYRLTRSWGPGPRIMFGMLNPSKADWKLNDPTVRRCIGFAKREGCGSMDVGNLLDYRATDPEDLEPARIYGFLLCGPDHSRHLREMAADADIVVAAWGSHKQATPLVISRFREAVDKPLMCLGTTKSGAPRHPLYVRSDQPLVPWLTAPPAVSSVVEQP